MGTGRVLGVQVLSVESGPGWQDTAPASHGSLKGKNVPGAQPAGRREHAKHCSPRGGSTGQGSPGGSGPGISPPNHPLPQLSPWVLQGSWLTWPEWLALGGGGVQPAPNPLPGLASKPRADVCRPGCFSANFLSHALSALRAPAGTGAGGGGDTDTAPQGHAEGCLLAAGPVSPHPEVPSRGANPLVQKHPWPLAGYPRWQGVPSLGGAAPTWGPPPILPQGHRPSPADCPLRCRPLCSTCGPGGQWQCEDHACLMDGELIDAINRGNYG